MLSAGFTIVRDMGNNGNYADTALRVGIEQGWIPGPTIINSGIIIGSMGGQFFPTPEMAKDHAIVYPEYLDADTPDEIVKAVRQNMLFGAKVIKICADCKPWGYSVDDIKLVVERSGEGGLQGGGALPDGGRRAACDRRRRVVDRPRLGHDGREPPADGAEGRVARRHRDADLADRPHDEAALRPHA